MKYSVVIAEPENTLHPSTGKKPAQHRISSPLQNPWEPAFPISAITASAEVMDAAPAGTIGGTYCGNPLACAAAIKTMEIMKAEDYRGKSMHIGKVVTEAFEKMKEKYSVIGDVRGLGGMIGVEFVKDKESKEPNPEFVKQLIQSALQKGLLLENAGSAGNVIRFLAPLCMTDEQMEAGLKIFEDAIIENL